MKRTSVRELNVEFGLEYVAARPKKAVDDTAPIQQGMRDDKPFTRNPSTDQSRVRRQLSRSVRDRGSRTQGSLPEESSVSSDSQAGGGMPRVRTSESQGVPGSTPRSGEGSGREAASQDGNRDALRSGASLDRRDAVRQSQDGKSGLPSVQSRDQQDVPASAQPGRVVPERRPGADERRPSVEAVRADERSVHRFGREAAGPMRGLPTDESLARRSLSRDWSGSGVALPPMQPRSGLHERQPGTTPATRPIPRTMKESRMPTEAELLAKIASAQTRAEQRQYAIELEELRTSKIAAHRHDRELDLANTVVENRWPTTIATTALNRHTAASDWLDEVEPGGADHTAVERHMRATANVWFDRQPDVVKADMDEMTARSHAWARREASQFGAAASAGYEAAIAQIEHLHGRHVAKLRAQADASATQPLDSTHITDSGSSLPRGVDNKDTFDDSLFGPAGASDPKSTTDTSDAPSLSEGSTPEGDQAQSVTEPDATTQTYDQASKDTSATDYLDGTKTPNSNASGATFSSRRVQADDQDSADWETSEVPSLAEGGPIGRDEAQSPVDPDSDGSTTYDKSNGSGTATDYLDGSTYPKQGHRQGSSETYDMGYAIGMDHKSDDDFSDGVDDAVDGRPIDDQKTGSLAAIATAIEADFGRTLSARAVPFLAAMKTLPSKHASIGGISGDAVIRYFLAAADLRGPKAAQHIAALNRVLAGDVPPEFKEQQKGDGDSSDSSGGQTCSVCGDKIEKDPSGEEPSTWHHDNGEKHDHEAKPGSSKESAASVSDDETARLKRENDFYDDLDAEDARLEGERNDARRRLRGASKSLSCGSCGNKWSTNAQYKLDCPKCGASESVKWASVTAAKSGDTATCHADGGPIQFFDGAWYHLSGGPSHNDVYPATPKEQADKDKTAAVQASTYCPNHGVYVGAGNQEQHDHCKTEQRESKDSSVDTSRLAAFRQRVAANLATVTAAEKCSLCGSSVHTDDDCPFVSGPEAQKFLDKKSAGYSAKSSARPS